MVGSRADSRVAALSREAAVHGPRFWMRPLVLELGPGWRWPGFIGGKLSGLGWFASSWRRCVSRRSAVLHWQFISHVILFCWMLAASFIDIDEKIIPDEITVTGTLLGLLFATLVPMSLLPHVEERLAAPAIGERAGGATDACQWPARGRTKRRCDVAGAGDGGCSVDWPPAWGAPRHGRSLAIGLGCYWLWCFALAPRIWRGRRGARFALRLILAP